MRTRLCASSPYLEFTQFLDKVDLCWPDYSIKLQHNASQPSIWHWLFQLLHQVLGGAGWWRAVRNRPWQQILWHQWQRLGQANTRDLRSTERSPSLTTLTKTELPTEPNTVTRDAYQCTLKTTWVSFVKIQISGPSIWRFWFGGWCENWLLNLYFLSIISGFYCRWC